MGKFIDLTGQRFGKLVVMRRLENSKGNRAQWLCKCDCGNTIIYTCNNLKRGSRVKNCGCLNNHDLTGRKFGKLTALKTEKKDKFGHCIWLCKCDCGNTKNVLETHLVRGNIRSCGCLSKKNKFLYENKYGNSRNYKRLYSIFNGMRSRCYNVKDVNYKNYGARGIKIYDKWINNFFKFMDWAMQNGYKEGLTIDRIDVNGNYEPDNCRWITLKEQENNRRDNVFLKYKGKVKTLKQWAETINIPYNTLYSRYFREIELVNSSVKSQIDISKILYKKDLRKKEKKGEK